MDIYTWTDTPPDSCQICLEKIENLFVDGKLAKGPWAIMCPACALINGIGLGEGKGQLYVRSADVGDFIKIRG